jgi:hypothetical protein
MKCEVEGDEAQMAAAAVSDRFGGSKTGNGIPSMPE